MAAKKALCYVIILLLAAGVIATLLVVLMVPSVSQGKNNDEVMPPEPTEPLQPTEPPLGNGFAYAEVDEHCAFTHTQKRFMVPGFGSFKGHIPSEGAAIFAGIPFSEPPIGDARWKKPSPLSSLSNPESYYDATFSRPGCPQICSLPSPEYVCPSEIDEDCLHINVYVPKKLLKTAAVNSEGGFELIDNIQDAKIPVMVFFYGGAFTSGGNGVTLYDARFLAEKGEVIVAVPNYRVGPFGFFYQNNGTTSHPALGNFGIYDQIEALRWVNDKIGYFGGDPTQITIFGESAGAQSVAVHLVSEDSNPLFKAAILESNPFALNYKTTDEAQDTCDKFVESFTTNKCSPNDMECLRDLTMDEILVALKNFPLEDQFNKDSITQLFEPWAPIIDDNLLTEHPFYTFRDGNNQDKPILHGTTKDEGMFFVIAASEDPIQSDQIYKGFLRIVFGKENVDKITQLYPSDCGTIPRDCDNRYPLNDIVTDYMFTCPSRKVFNIPSRDHDPALKVWWYTFNQVWSFPQFWDNYTECGNLVCHSAELPYVFDIDGLTAFAFTEEESLLADKMVYYWSNFAKYGDPNPPTTNRRHIRSAITVNKLGSRTEAFPPTVSSWPRIYEMYEGSAGGEVQYQTMNLIGSGETVVDNFMKEKCDFWDTLNLYLEDEIKIGRNINNLKKIFETLNDS